MPKKADRRLRVGVLGCGPIAQAAHFESCTKAANADLYAICDVADDLRERMAATHAPQRTFADYDAMLADSFTTASSSVTLCDIRATTLPDSLKPMSNSFSTALMRPPPEFFSN